MGKRSHEKHDGEIDKKEKKKQRKEAKKLRSLKDRNPSNAGAGTTGQGQEHLTELESYSLACRVPQWPVFHEKKLELSMALLPIDLRNTVKAVESSLRNMLFKFSDEMGGVLISFSDVQMQHDGLGKILSDLPHIHFNVICKVLLFRPVKKSTLVGQVKESFPSHLSLTVYHYFNASLTASCLHENGYTFQKSTSEWLKKQASPSNDSSIAVGSKLRFEVSSVHESGGIISIEGSNPTICERNADGL